MKQIFKNIYAFDHNTFAKNINSGNWTEYFYLNLRCDFDHFREILILKEDNKYYLFAKMSGLGFDYIGFNIDEIEVMGIKYINENQYDYLQQVVQRWRDELHKAFQWEEWNILRALIERAKHE